MVKIIYLTKGRAAIVDDCDYNFLTEINWYARKPKSSSTFYAMHVNRKTKSGKAETLLMHRLIMERMLEEKENYYLLEKFMNYPKKYPIDHISGHGLDNTRSNLRIVNHRQNHQNRHNKKSSIYPGVCWEKSRSKWKARIYINGHRKHLGYFEEEKEAYFAYRDAIHSMIGEKVVCELEGAFDAV